MIDLTLKDLTVALLASVNGDHAEMERILEVVGAALPDNPPVPSTEPLSEDELASWAAFILDGPP